MWQKFYRDYLFDEPLVKYKNEAGHGIIGCEMHDLNGWGNSHHISPKEWGIMNDAKRKSHMGSGTSLSSLPKM